ncbi:MAG: hypothetical protein LQ338_004009 [Usnochroma carphineum]|nr:MAG: hypothetical protein LQ338_004009 [Usnochroma carphineum]
MLAIPLRSQPGAHLSRPVSDPSRHQDPIATSAAPAFSANAMISMMPTPRSLSPKRPKLSLQTNTASIPPAGNKPRAALNNLSSAVSSPTTFRNTYENAFEAQPSTAVSANPRIEEASTQLRQPERPSPHTASSSSSISTASSGPTSPFTKNAPYTLALGARSILRNSPLPRRHLANMSNRPPKRMFQPIKRVAFHESLVEMIPTPVLSDSEDSTEGNGLETTSPAGKKMRTGPNPIGKPNDVSGRGKRRGRDWIWRPMDDEVSSVQANGHSMPPTALASSQETTAFDSRLPISPKEPTEPQNTIS